MSELEHAVRVILLDEEIPFDYVIGVTGSIKVVNHTVFSPTIQKLFKAGASVYYNDQGELIIHGWK